MALRLIGSAVTDSNGNAILEDGYTGTGAGFVDIIAEATIDDSTVVSQPVEVLDCLQYDTGIEGSATNIYTLTNMTRTPNGEYTVFEETNNTAYAKITDIPFDTAIEFDVYCPDGGTTTAVFYLAKSSVNYYASGIGTYGMDLNNWYTVRVTVKSDLSLEIKNLTNSTTVTDTYTNGDTTANFGFWFCRPGAGTKIYVKNVKVYPI